MLAFVVNVRMYEVQRLTNDLDMITSSQAQFTEILLDVLDADRRERQRCP